MHMGVSINNRVAIYGNKTWQYELTINLKSLNQILNGFCEIELLWTASVRWKIGHIRVFLTSIFIVYVRFLRRISKSAQSHSL